MKTAYLDYNATTPLDPRVLECMRPFLESQFANASSFHRLGQKSRHAVEEAREKIAVALQVEPGDIIFTSGGTESNNLAMKGVIEQAPGEKSLMVSSIEHQSVLFPAKYLGLNHAKVSIIPVHSTGVVDLDFIQNHVLKGMALVSVMHANNELGTVQPIEQIAKIVHAQGALFHTDAVQTFGKLIFFPEEIGVDLASISSHKICGPKGAGALYIRKGVKLKAQLHGGHQEKNIRPGTENVAAIVGFGEAAHLAVLEREQERNRVGRLRDLLEAMILKEIPKVVVNGTAEKLHNTLNCSFEGIDGETLLMSLDLENIYVSTGSACTAGSVEPSHVLMALGMSEAMARSAIRFSLGRFSDQSDVESAVTALKQIVQRLRKNATNNRGKVL